MCLEYQIGNGKGGCAVDHNIERRVQTSHPPNKIHFKGNISSVLNYLKIKTREYADNFEFEKADITKQQSQTLEDYQSKSTIVNPKINDVDVFNLYEQRAFVSYLKVMNGTIIQTKIVELSKKLDESPEDLLTLAS